MPAAFLLTSDHFEGPVGVLALLRTLPGGFRLAYLPHAPEIQSISGGAPGSLLFDACRSVVNLLEERIDLARFDLSIEASSELLDARNEAFRPSLPIQPPDTIQVDLTESEEAILSRMKSKTRYNIGLSRRRGVKIRRSGIADLPDWYALHRVTAMRDRIAIHPIEYYRALFELAADDDSVEIDLFMAESEGTQLAGNIVAQYAGTGYYLFGASANVGRNLMPTYGLQWAGIAHCRDSGCTTYDLWGIPPSDDPSHPMHGLYQMKSGFGGAVIHRAGAWDIPVRPLRYRAYRFAERIRNRYVKRRRRRGID